MWNTIDVRRMHEAYEEADADTQEVISEAYKHVIAEFKAAGWNCCGDDRAEELVAALMHYKIRCEKK